MCAGPMCATRHNVRCRAPDNVPGHSQIIGPPAKQCCKGMYVCVCARARMQLVASARCSLVSTAASHWRRCGALPSLRAEERGGARHGVTQPAYHTPLLPCPTSRWEPCHAPLAPPWPGLLAEGPCQAATRVCGRLPRHHHARTLLLGHRTSQYENHG